MAGKSKLTEYQWAEVEKCLLDGETQEVVSKRFGISRRALAGKMGSRVKAIQDVATQMVDARKTLEVMPIASQINAQTLINRLMNISDHMTSAAEYSARNAHKLSRLATDHLESVDSDTLLNDPNTLRVVTGLTTMANEASKIPLGLINASKEQMQRINEPEAENIKTLDDFYGNSSSSNS